ncbi:MAG: hypothetical protein WDM80_01580 [Limisphaerales bacterium]
MKIRSLTIASLSVLSVFSTARAVSLDDIQFWTGTGTNRAALVIYWNAPEVRNNTSVPNPAAEKSLVWGYRWNGTNNAEQMFNAVVAADHRLFVTAAAPYPGFGAFIYSIGYDLNNNGVFGLCIGTNTFAENAFTNGQRVFTTEDSDSAKPLDAGDLFWSGLYGANWEMWQEQGGAGGFINAPDRGTAPYWTPLDTMYFSYGYHGQWDYASGGLQGTTIQNGSWIGFTISAGGLNYLDDTDPGTIAYDYHKHAPIPPTAASTNSVYAVQIIAAQGPFGASPYNDTNCILGAPATRFYESVSKPATRVKIVEPAYNYAPDKTNKLIITLNTGSSIIAKFNQPVYDNPANPYGMDFEVFGNAFYAGNGFSSDTANMNIYKLTSGGFYEPTKVSVSPGYTGQPGEIAGDASTWPWYRYDNGPYADTDCPTQGYKWNRAETNWTDEVMDFTKPVNPALKTKLNTSGSTLSAADAMDLYDGSGGGTGFDLKPSGFAWIQYIKVEGIAGFTGGEVDAMSIIRPMTIGDTMSISPANLTNNTTQFFFQKPGAENQNILSLNFTNVSDVAQIKTARLDDPALLGSVVGTPVNALQLTVAAILNTNVVSFYADLGLSGGANYTGNGGDLHVAQWTGTNWLTQPFAFNPTNNTVIIAGVTNLSAFVVSQIIPPQLSLQSVTNGFAFQFTPVANCPQTLERSTDLVTWVSLATFTPTNSILVTLTDTNAPADKAFYRLHLTIP